MAFLRPKNAPVTTALLIIITIVFAFEWLNGAVRNEEVLIGMGAIMPGMMHSGQYWRALAGMFLHANLLHIIGRRTRGRSSSSDRSTR